MTAMAPVLAQADEAMLSAGMILPQSRQPLRRHANRPSFRPALGLMLALATIPVSSALAQTQGPAQSQSQAQAKLEDRLSPDADPAPATTVATPDNEASLQISAPEAPTRLTLVLAPAAIEPGEQVFIDVYLMAVDANGQPPSPADTAQLSAADASRLAGTLAFTEANEVGEEEYFVVNVPPGMRFPDGAAVVTIRLTDGAAVQGSAVELRSATLLR
ncbi:hypothetical protein E3C22_10090 [Jiella endophytica]|uniref:Uncharacterized protein n=1 Tax=Jiella endophytica TaxID=2558362 RepID=A0A4Y8RID2_9HYPH|nr:hypothetical protein [Jiella endophytica]TFF22809.1 hypothetical protein E3C22_10090 [Jiella endophytica]